MNERLTKCPLCKSGLFLNYRSAKDHMISLESFLLCQCSQCTLVFTNPRPSETSITKYYDSRDYISHQDKSTSFTDFLYKLVRKFTLRSKLSWIKKYHGNSVRVLDYGCGTGYFLKAAQNHGWKVMGIEPNKLARNTAKGFGIKVFENLTEIFDEEKFDAITLFHVLEHIHSLRLTLKGLVKKLKKSGTLFLAVPNLQSFDSIYYQEKWAALDVPRHLYHFTKTSMSQLAKEMKLEIVEQKPMVFDSYYVSILSEKYKNPQSSNLNNLIRAVKSGFISNYKGRKNENNHSSILFILKKK